MQALRQVVLASVLAMLAAGCTRGPDEAGLARDVQQGSMLFRPAGSNCIP
jgi:hypothetical protein